MPTGEGPVTIVHYKGPETEEDFIVHIQDVDEYKKWKDGDRTIPLTHFVDSYKVFVTNKQGTQGKQVAPPKSTLENEFKTSKEVDVVALILEKGDLQESKSAGRQGLKNDSNGSR